MSTVDAALGAARQAGLDRLDAQLLLGHVLQRSRTWLLTHGDQPLDAPQRHAFEALCARRRAGEPLAYLVGTREFHGLALNVGPAVLVPRPDTEVLVDWALELLHGALADRPQPRVLDLGTGSGAIALAIRHGCPRAEVWASERSPEALAVAQSNAARLGLPVGFRQGDWWVPWADDLSGFDLVVSNPPYIAPGDAHLDALVHEPLSALVAADAGLADLDRIIHGAHRHLRPGAWLLLEHGWDQAERVAASLGQAGFASVSTRHDLGPQPRCTGGCRASVA